MRWVREWARHAGSEFYHPGAGWMLLGYCAVLLLAAWILGW